MSRVQFVGDLLESNGRTVKENNLEIKHNIPLGTLVEIKLADDEGAEDPKFGLRLYVGMHSRDCDGTPLYVLSHKKNMQQELEKLEKEIEELSLSPNSVLSSGLLSLTKMQLSNLRGSAIYGYSEDCLLVIK